MTRTKAGVCALIAIGLWSTPPSFAYTEGWNARGTFTDIRAIDCSDCEEQIGIIFACTGNGQPAEITVNAAAAKRGKDGAFAPVTFNIDGKRFTYEARTTKFGAIGYAPVFQVAYDDPLTAALQGARSAVVTFNGQRANLSLKGSRSALEIFRAHCGWTPQGFEQNLQRTAAQNPQPSQGSGTQQQGQTKVFGVEDGEAHTQPNANGELWFTSGFASKGSSSPQIFYGIPETDAIAWVGSCGGSGDTYGIDLMIATGNRQTNQPVQVEFVFEGHPPKVLSGTTFTASSESAGIRLQVGAMAPFWNWFSTAKSISFGVQGQPKITLPGAAAAGQFFLSQCDRLGAQVEQVPTQPAQDTAVLSKVFAVTCPSGASFNIQFENSPTKSRAILYPGLPQQLILEPIATGSGAAYRNGPLTISTKGNQVTVDSNGRASQCSMQ